MCVRTVPSLSCRDCGAILVVRVVTAAQKAQERLHECILASARPLEPRS